MPESRKHLGLAAASDTTIDGCSGKNVAAREQSCLATAESSSSLAHSRNLLILHLDKSASCPGPTLLLGLVVGGDVEGDEEQEVRAEDGHASKGGKLLTGAGAHVGHPGEVAAREVGVRGKVNEAKVDDELEDLHDGDVLLPPDADATGGLEVVPVHDDVNHQVEDNGNPGDGGVAKKLGVAEKSGGTVVIGVEEG